MHHGGNGPGTFAAGRCADDSGPSAGDEAPRLSHAVSHFLLYPPIMRGSADTIAQIPTAFEPNARPLFEGFMKASDTRAGPSLCLRAFARLQNRCCSSDGRLSSARSERLARSARPQKQEPEEPAGPRLDAQWKAFNYFTTNSGPLESHLWCQK